MRFAGYHIGLYGHQRNSNYMSARCQMLKKQKNLVHVDFSDCLLRNDGAALIASSLSSRGHGNLENINLSFNEILADGGVKLVKSLKGKVSLKEIHLDG